MGDAPEGDAATIADADEYPVAPGVEVVLPQLEFPPHGSKQRHRWDRWLGTWRLNMDEQACALLNNLDIDLSEAMESSGSFEFSIELGRDEDGENEEVLRVRIGHHTDTALHCDGEEGDGDSDFLHWLHRKRDKADKPKRKAGAKKAKAKAEPIREYFINRRYGVGEDEEHDPESAKIESKREKLR